MTDKEEKKAELSIRNNFVKWLNIEGLDSVVYVLGNKIIGKSTVCHLLKRAVDGFNDPNFKFVQKKKQFEYEYEGQINPKATKPLTIYPKLYKIQTTNTNIIQVPPKFYDIQKKRPHLDKLITLVGISYTAKKGKFLFFVDANKTSGKLDHWKKSFPTVLDSFEDNFFDENALNSMGFVFTKAKDSEKEVYLNRIPDLRKTFTNEDAHKDLYINLLDIISNNQRVGVFTKISTELAAESQAKTIADVYQSLSETNMLRIENGEEQNFINMKPVQLTKQEKELYDNFVEPLKLILDLFAQLYEKIFTSKGPVDIKQFIQQKSDNLNEITKRIFMDSDKQQGEESKCLNSRYTQLIQISSKTKDLSVKKQQFYQTHIGKCLFFVQFKQKIFKMQNLRYKSLKTLLQVLAEHGLFIKEDQFKPLYMELIIFSLFEERFGPLIANFDFEGLLRNQEIAKIFTQENQNQLKEAFLNSSFVPTSNQEIKTLIESTLDRLFPESSQSSDSTKREKVQSIKKKLATSPYDSPYPKKNICLLYKQLQAQINAKKESQKMLTKQPDIPEQEIATMNELALKLAKNLTHQEIKRGDLCFGIFRDSGDFAQAKKCLQSAFKQPENQKLSDQDNLFFIMSYIDLFIEMGLLENAMTQCYEYAQIHNELRPKLFEKMKEVRKQYQQNFSQDFELKFLGKTVKLFDFFQDEKTHKKIIKFVAELQLESKTETLAEN